MHRQILLFWSCANTANAVLFTFFPEQTLSVYFKQPPALTGHLHALLSIMGGLFLILAALLCSVRPTKALLRSVGLASVLHAFILGQHVFLANATLAMTAAPFSVLPLLTGLYFIVTAGSVEGLDAVRAKLR